MGGSSTLKSLDLPRTLNWEAGGRFLHFPRNNVIRGNVESDLAGGSKRLSRGVLKRRLLRNLEIHG